MEGAGVGEVEVRRVGCAVNEGLISRLQPVKEPNNYESVQFLVAPFGELHYLCQLRSFVC